MERIKRGEMTRELLLIPLVKVTDPYNSNDQMDSWPEESGIKVWSKAQIDQGREFWAARQLRPELSGAVWIDFRDDINEQWRIKDIASERIFDIVAPPIDYMMEGRTFEIHLKLHLKQVSQ